MPLTAAILKIVAFEAKLAMRDVCAGFHPSSAAGVGAFAGDSLTAPGNREPKARAMYAQREFVSATINRLERYESSP